jgi:predicted molibdopterin-dependent oxidoreductase YjgC
MSARRIPGIERAVLRFTFNGAPMSGLAGDTIAAALLAEGIRRFRTTAKGDARGMWCGMGVCWECIVDVVGEGSVRACMAELREGMVLRSMAGREPSSP